MRAQDVRQALSLAAPVMLAYASIGVPCGVMEAQVGFTPLMAFLFSATHYSGAGQFMVSNLWMAGTPLASIVLSVPLVTTRQMLYSAAFAPYLGKERRRRAFGFAALVTDETFGVNLDRFSSADGWDLPRANVVNVASILSWACANGVGAALGAVLSLPTDVNVLWHDGHLYLPSGGSAQGSRHGADVPDYRPWGHGVQAAGPR